MQLILLGMHRSGTSVLARLLNLMGAYFGAEGISTGANQENPKGFWERRDIRALNDAVLQGSGWDWNRVARVDLRMVPPAILEDFDKSASRLILEMDAHRPWMMKEPRLCLLLPLWRRWLEVPVGIHIYRNPVEVASSLNKRNGIPIPAGLAMWERYVQSALDGSEGMPRIVVSHRELMTDPRAAVVRLLEDLQAYDVPGLRMPTGRELDAFISADLYREREDRDDLRQYMESRQVALFEQLKAGGIPPSDAWNVPVETLEAYESTLPPLKRPEAAAPAPAPNAGIGEEIKAIRSLIGKQDTEAKQRDERFAKALRDELRSQAAAADVLLQQKVADLRMQRTALHHQLREARRDLAGTRQHGEDARIELAVMRPKVEQLDRQIAESLGRIEALRDEREALRLHGDELRTELAAARSQADALRAEGVVARQEIDGLRNERDALRAEGAVARQEIDGLRSERDALREDGDKLRTELAAARSQADTLRAAEVDAGQTIDVLRGERESLRSQRETLEAELAEARDQVSALRADEVAARQQADLLRGELEASRLHAEGLRDELAAVGGRTRELIEAQDTLRAEFAASSEREAALESRLRDTAEELRASAALAGQLEQDVDTRYGELAELTRLLLRRESELEQRDAGVADARRQLAETTESLAKVVGSRSWRMTRPARYLGRLFSTRSWERQGDKRASDTTALVLQSGLFDPDWYRREYADVARSGMDPVEHFLQFGAVELRNPGPDFDTGLYLRQNPDVADSGLNPLLHYLSHGKDEGRACK